MSQLNFENRVAVITGAGRGLGRSYALLLAARGARVVVNDIGSSVQGEGADLGPAEEVVAEIRAAGGEAVACTDSVATVEGGKAIVQCAMDSFGQVDILIHNAGNVRPAPLDEISYEDFESVLDVHLRGGFHVLRPAFPLMRDAGYGRIVLTSSINGIYGNAKAVNYSVSKAGLIGLSNVAAIEGAEFGIKSNVILPAAVTRMADGLDTSAYPPMDPELVAPAVGWLAHERCSVSGEMLIALAGRIARAYVVESPGVYRPSWTIEDVDAEMGAIREGGEPLHFAPAPSGHIDHLRYSFGVASGN
ncbi:SDR family NAD(P)-dependent oxidoreductase [Mangrovimicrobium sediminis]|uniref:SDR family NAD(P)-dependent oxidoreductase n=1 Tax=Mangrovimicrobium sediminis TaxID=2562682 RepID=A0A4Z0LVA6_9GAMM|nr:SDR family NAD(P)-dependent oxidoreductase [Haliea sp. SAOS-164]TGD71046.1 SDR family NAD(P)-dependent oxidoreductase [Haliea sp. SAOS-164]